MAKPVRGSPDLRASTRLTTMPMTPSSAWSYTGAPEKPASRLMPSRETSASQPWPVTAWTKPVDGTASWSNPLG